MTKCRMRQGCTWVAALVMSGGIVFAGQAQQVKPSNPPPVAADSPAAEKLVKEALEGDPLAQVILGSLLYGAKEGASAARWLRMAAVQGEGMAQSLLGDILVKGLGVPVDFAEGFKWSLKGAEQGYFQAQANLSVMYLNGDGVMADDMEAAKWALKAAEQDCPAEWRHKCANVRALIGGFYSLGKGVPRDDVQAYMWLNMAAAMWSNEFGENLPAEQREIVAGGMTPQQIAEAQQLNREWKPKPFKG